MSSRHTLEIERKFTVSTDTATPELAALPAVDSVAGPVDHILSAVYFDTADLRLARAKRTLRRRTGGDDPGWHLKMPAGTSARTELQNDLEDGADESTPPEELLEAIRGIVRGAELVPIARIDNRRSVYVVHGPNGRPAAEFCDDMVTAESYLPGGAPSAWREWELELVGGGDEAFLNMLSAALVTAGARPSHSPSKLVQALGDSEPRRPAPPHPHKVSRKSSAHVVLEAVRTNYNRMVEMDPAVRRDDRDSVHQMRVATRELRSNLQTFSSVLDLSAHGDLVGELRWIAGVLGEARDAEVVRDRFGELVASESAAVVDDTARSRLTTGMQERYRTAHAESVRQMSTGRYYAILDSIEDLLADPPLRPAAKKKPRTILGGELTGAYRRLRRSIARADVEGISDEDRAEAFHDLRKKAKRLRYSTQAVEGGSGMDFGGVRQSCKRLQTELGEFQDAVQARHFLREIRAAARAAGEDTFAYGLLYQREREIGRAALDGYEASVAAIIAAWESTHPAEARRHRKAGKKSGAQAGKKSGGKSR